MKKDPIKRTLKAGRRVGKALSVFENAADELEIASAEHLAAAEELEARAVNTVVQAELTFRADYERVTDAYVADVERLSIAYADSVDNAEAILSLVDDNMTSAEVAQIQADSLRSLLAVA